MKFHSRRQVRMLLTSDLIGRRKLGQWIRLSLILVALSSYMILSGNTAAQEEEIGGYNLFTN